jgi:bifunctional non-homologous end joining protein LigD
VDGIFLSDFEQGEIGPDLFQCGLEGMAQSTARAYRGGKFRHWIGEEPAHPAFSRVQDQF